MSTKRSKKRRPTSAENFLPPQTVFPDPRRLKRVRIHQAAGGSRRCKQKGEAGEAGAAAAAASGAAPAAPDPEASRREPSPSAPSGPAGEPSRE